MLVIVLVLLLYLLFFLASKMNKWDSLAKSSFECGFSSYFWSRQSFSIHYFFLSLLFLFLDLELCLIMPFFESSMKDQVLILMSFIFIAVVLTGLLYEWWESKLNWVF